MIANALHAVCLIQDEEGIGDEATYENGDGSYLLLADDRLYCVTSTGAITMTRTGYWDIVKVATR